MEAQCCSALCDVFHKVLLHVTCTSFSTVTLLLVTAIEFSQLLLANASRLAGLRGAAGASRLC